MPSVSLFVSRHRQRHSAFVERDGIAGEGPALPLRPTQPVAIRGGHRVPPGLLQYDVVEVDKFVAPKRTWRVTINVINKVYIFLPRAKSDNTVVQ